jgi:MoaA/NifB/PqqE/SkfB family radical SAM enzyme
MDLELYKSLIDSLSKHGTRLIGIAGIGEPLLHKNIAEAVAYARERNIRVWLTTNGSRLEPSLMKDLAQAGLNDLCVSLNSGTREEYSLVHSNQDDAMFDNIVQNLEWLREYKKNSDTSLPRLTLSNVVSNINSHRIAEMMHVGIKVGAATVAYKPIDFFPQTQQFALGKQDLDNLQQGFVQAAKLAAQSHISTNIPAFDQMLELRDSKTLPAPCFAGWLSPLVLANGDVTFCCISREVLGSLVESSFEDIWFGAKHKRLNDAAIKIHKTQQPVSKSRCFGCEQMMTNLKIHRYLWPLWGKARTSVSARSTEKPEAT